MDRYVYVGDRLCCNNQLILYGDILVATSNSSDNYGTNSNNYGNIKFIHEKTFNQIELDLSLFPSILPYTKDRLESSLCIIDHKLTSIINLQNSLGLSPNSYLVISSLILCDVCFKIGDVLHNFSYSDSVISFEFNSEVYKGSLFSYTLNSSIISLNEIEFKEKLIDIEMKKEKIIMKYNLLNKLLAGID